MPEVSIIIPVYNVEEYMAECLISVIKQKATCSMECLVIDDCGSDRSMDIVREVIASYSGPISFRIIKREQNGGLSAARNSGIRAAKGKYIYFLDSDDLLTPDCIEVLFKRACEHPGVQIVTGDFQTFPEPDVHKLISLQGKNFPEYSDDIAWIRSIFLTTFPIIACNKLILKSFITDNRLYFKEGVLHEDNHWHANAYHCVNKIGFVNKITYLYRIRKGSITANPNVASRKLENLTKIYLEMFAKKTAWDKPWAKWILNSVESFRYSPDYELFRLTALNRQVECVNTLLESPSTPLFMKLLFRYYKMPQHKGKARIIYSLFNWYWSI